jgi:uncharacterized protein (TIGR04141 family)
MTVPKNERVNFFLLRDGLEPPAGVIKDDRAVEVHEAGDGLAFRAILYVAPVSSRSPGWVTFLKPTFASALDSLLNSSTAAVLCFQAGGRWFAVAFGHGRSLIEPTAYEPDFGLKVALNTVNADKLRSVDLRVLDDMVLTRRVQASRGSATEVFGMDPSRDLLRGVTGEPRAELGLGKRLAGADSLVLLAELDLPGLPAKAADLLSFYKRTDYLARFGWVDRVKRVRKEQTPELDQLLVAAIANLSNQTIYLAPPVALDWSKVDGFRFSREPDGTATHVELDLDDYLRAVNGAPSLGQLRSHEVWVFEQGSSEPSESWSVYRSLVFQAKHRDHLYLLVEGQWFEVAKTFSDDVDRRLTNIPKIDLGFPACQPNEREDHYNAGAVADDRTHRALMDKKLITAFEAREPFELCDIFTDSRQLIHVKKRYASSSLSHLFAQGRIAAQAFLRDDTVREKARLHLREANPALEGLVPLPRPESGREFEIVFAIIADNDSGLPGNLPFFSRLNLVLAAEEIRDGSGYRVAVAGIPQL